MHVTLIAVASLDGFITRHKISGTHFASEADGVYFQKALKGFDCSIFGANTYRQSRDIIVSNPTEDRLRVVLTNSPEVYLQEARKNAIEFSNSAPETLLKELESRGYRRCALLGGSRIYALFTDRNLIDEWWITLEPIVFGSGLSLCPGEWNLPLKLRSTERNWRLYPPAQIRTCKGICRYELDRNVDWST